ncbi:MAG: DUF1592 domain-containing protein [Gemmatimonadota bacterium]|jgi:hypothetical protein|nr:DUF1592 domain-containing protein [Gemmatimonadota bacterium]
MRPIVISAAALGLAAVVGSQLPGVREAFGEMVPVSSAGLSAVVANVSRLRAGSPRTAPDILDPRAVQEAALASSSISTDELTGVIDRYCVGCHSDRAARGNLSLQGFDVAHADQHAELAEKLIRKLRLEMMPPPDMPRPRGDTMAVLVETLEKIVDQAAAAAPARPGTRRFQRLNREEYERVIQDLLGLEVDAERWLPGDRFVRSFDTWSTVQNLSATTLDAYLRAAEEISRMAVGLGEQLPPSVPVSYQVPEGYSQHAWDHVEGTPFGTRGGMVVLHDFSMDGEYVISVQAGSGRNAVLTDIDISIDGEPVALLSLPAGAGRNLSTDPIFVRGGQHQLSVAFTRETDGPYDDTQSPLNLSVNSYAITGLPFLNGITVDGPFNAVAGASGDARSREMIFTCRPSGASDEATCAETILTRLAREAYRRPLEREDVSELMQSFTEGRQDGDFDLGIRNGVQWILSSPSFLFRLEREPENIRQGEAYALSDIDLASRLSFFIWSTGPDDELIRLAEQGRLNRPEVLEAQVRRMLADPRSESLSTRFVPQWLRMDELDAKRPLVEFFPDFNRALAGTMRRETELFFDYVLRQNRSFMELFTANYTFVNDPLAHHYSIPSPGSGNEFQKVTLTDPNRFGLLGKGSILMVTSFNERTSPVVRGQWVMEVLLGSPPPPPPPNIPLLSAIEGATAGRILTTRERLEIHRTDPTCNACHQFMDPIGLALDNFDGVGRWRDRDENGSILHTQSTFYDGTVINTSSDLTKVILSRPEPVVRNFINNLYGYAIGRRSEYFDQPAVREIERQVKRDGYRMSSFILAIVKSDAFRMRQADVLEGNVTMADIERTTLEGR